ncbi:MAG: HEAT repeat domain-containing protein, partial [Calditrichia bacterium]|nr:HEAT repeat domain-containing protein [Calditrichia bacterium]
MKKNLALITLLIVLFSIFLFSCKNNNDALLSKLKEIEYNRNSNANLLLSSVKSNDKEIRLLATQVLARIQSAESKDILVKLFNDENSDIRNWAVFGLGQLRDSSMAAFLVEQLKIEPDNRVKSNILVALGKTGINDKDMIFIPYLKNNDPEVASAAAMGIAFKAIQKDVSLKTVKELENIYLNSINIKVKGAVAFALFRIADTTDLKIFEQMLTDNNINTRYYAIRGLLASLRKIKEEFKSDNKFSDFILKEKNINLRKILKIGLNDKNWEIQYYSFSLLEFIPGIDISEKFISEPEKNHKYIIQALLNNLRYLNPESAKAILSKLLVSKNNHISGMAHAEQTREEPDEGLMFIKRILQNPSQPDLYYAVEALNLVPDNLLKEYK